MIETDVLIVGAGPAGLSAAKQIQYSGNSCIIVERQNAIGTKLKCGGGVPANLFDLTGIKKKKKFIKQKIKGSKIYYNDEEYTISHENWSGFVLDRQEFDKHLADAAKNVGVEIVLSTEFNNFISKRKRVYSYLNNGELIKSKFIIASDGCYSTVRKILTPSIKIPYILAVNYILSGQDISETNFWHFIFDDKFHGGYCWCFPWNKEQSNLGIAASPSHVSFKLLDGILSSDTIIKNKFISHAPEIINSGGGIFPLRLSNFSLDIVSDRILFTGDSAFLVEPIFGEGLFPAIISGIVAGDVISSALSEGVFSKTYLMRYVTELRQKKYSHDMSLGEYLNVMTSMRSDFYEAFSKRGSNSARREILRRISE